MSELSRDQVVDPLMAISHLTAAAAHQVRIGQQATESLQQARQTMEVVTEDGYKHLLSMG